MGDCPSSGEISEEVFEYITRRLKWKEECDEWKKEQDSRIEKLNEGTMDDKIKNDAKNRDSPSVTEYGSSKIVFHCPAREISSEIKCCIGLNYQFSSTQRITT